MATQSIRGQWLSLCRHFAGPAVAIILLDLLMLWGVQTVWPSDALPESVIRKIWLPIFFAATIMLMIDLVALGWVGMWTGVSARKAAHAPGGAVWRILLLPWLVFALLMTYGSIFPPARARNLEFWHMLTIWFVLGLINNIFWIVWARRRLFTRLRAAVAGRFLPKSLPATEGLMALTPRPESPRFPQLP